MPNSISPVLAPYLQSCLEDRSATLITSVLNTPANWLVLAFVKAAILRADGDSGVVSTSEHSSTQVVFLSILRPYEFWVELSKKIGLDLPTLISKGQLAYIDGLTTGLSVSGSTAKVIKPKSISLSDIDHAVTIARTALFAEDNEPQRTLLLIDGLDFVLASQPDINAVHVNKFLTTKQETFSNTAITVSADSPLLHNTEISATPLEMEHTIFLRTIAHQSNWVMQLRPLETGHATDVSGIIQISRGGADNDTDTALSDGEWLYQVKGDGSVRIWARGET